MIYTIEEIEENQRKQKKRSKKIRIIVYIILIPILICNIILIIQSAIQPKETPELVGIKSYVIISGSMQPELNIGDIVIVKKVEDLQEGDIISFRQGQSVITHRINEVIYEDGKTKYITKGDNNNTQDSGYVTPEQVEGVFQFKISRLGNLAMFVQTPIGMIVCLSIPVIILVVIQLNDNKKDKELIDEKMSKQKEMEKEIEKLKKQNEELKKK
mgnify:CR=1 FL=1